LNGDNFRVLGKDVFRNPTLGVIKFDILDFGCRNIIHAYSVMYDINHRNAPFLRSNRPV